MREIREVERFGIPVPPERAGRKIVVITNIDSVPWLNHDIDWRYEHSFFGDTHFSRGRYGKYGTFYAVRTQYFEVYAFRKGGKRPSFTKLENLMKSLRPNNRWRIEEKTAAGINHKVCLEALSSVPPIDLFEIIHLIHREGMFTGRKNLASELCNLIGAKNSTNP
jgi:hypothetical protein